MNRKITISFFVFLFGILNCSAYTVQSVPNPKTYNAANFVSNPDGILNGQTVSQINSILNSLEAETKAEVAVVAVNTIGDDDIKDFAVRLFERWGIGKSGADNGLLILFVLDQRKITFETGYGLEGILPDAISKRIQEQVMLPEFRKGDYDAGILAGVKQVSNVLREEPVVVPGEEPIDWGAVLPFAIAGYIVLMLISLFWMQHAISKIKKDAKYPNNIARYNAVKSQKSGITSIMAFIVPFILLFISLFFIRFAYVVLIIPVPFLVIPANLYAGYQMRKIRRQPVPCIACGGMMHLVPEKEEDKYLTPAQQLEEKLGSVDYDVFICDKCDEKRVFSLDKNSPYSRCPRCGTKAFSKVSETTVVSPTYTSVGVLRATYKCKFCGYEENKDTTIPRLQRSNNGALIGGMVAGSLLGGGRSGGGFSGGGGFGGGRSGGGGATSGW